MMTTHGQSTFKSIQRVLPLRTCAARNMFVHLGRDGDRHVKHGHTHARRFGPVERRDRLQRVAEQRTVPVVVAGLASCRVGCVGADDPGTASLGGGGTSLAVLAGSVGTSGPAGTEHGRGMLRAYSAGGSRPGAVAVDGHRWLGAVGADANISLLVSAAFGRGRSGDGWVRGDGRQRCEWLVDAGMLGLGLSLVSRVHGFG